MAINSVVVSYTVIQFSGGVSKMVRKLDEKLIFEFLSEFDAKNYTVYSIIERKNKSSHASRAVFDKIKEYMYFKEKTTFNILGDIKYICYEASNLLRVPVMYMTITREYDNVYDEFFIMVFQNEEGWKVLTIPKKFYENGNFTDTENVWKFRG